LGASWGISWIALLFLGGLRDGIAGAADDGMTTVTPTSRPENLGV